MAVSIVIAIFFAAFAAAQPKALTIEGAALHQFEDGPVLAPEYEFVPGEAIHFSCHVAGFQILKKDDKQSINLTWQIRALDPAGVPMDKDQSGRIAEGVSPQDKDWTPKFVANFMVPAFAPGGTYHIPVKVRDEVAGAETSLDLAFRVRGHEVEPSDTLIARNFEFLRSEDDKVPLNPAIYHPGDTLWARFDITGFRFGEKNHFSVDYGLAIVNAAGEQMFAQLVAAEDASESFYPQRYVPGVLSLRLDQNVPKGSYTLVVIMHDKAGAQKTEAREKFQVE